MDPRLFGEFMGTLVLALLGNGAVANVVLKKTLGSAAGWLTIVFGYGVGVMAGVFTAIYCGSLRPLINPGVTLAFSISGGDFSMFIPIWIAQVLGAIVAGCCCGFTSAALDRNPRRRIKARLLLAPALPFGIRYQYHQRDHRHVSAGFLFIAHGQDRTGSRD